MDKLVVLELEGDFELAGFRATLEIRVEQQLILKVKGSLPAAPEVASQIQRHWYQNYRSLGVPARIKGQKIVHKGSLNRRIVECRESAEVLLDRFRVWLNSESFQLIDRRLRESFDRDDSIRFLLRTDDLNLQKLPWHEWDFFERYPKAEIALSAPEYEAISDRPVIQKNKVRVLAILGNSRGIQLEHDRAILEQLPNADIEFLVEPERQQFSERLWQEAWDILFFAGHSETEGETGRLYINQTDSLTLSQLKYGLRKAIDRGLQLAIFNSCDGLGLVQELQQLRIPQLIVMREPITDQVAAVFLKYFLEVFSSGESLYLATRQARERLQGLEHQFPCASWLPIIYQDPLVTPPNWLTLQGRSTPRRSPRTSSRRWRSLRVLWVSVAATLMIMGIRSTGALQSVELSAYDALMRSRPTEAIDSRILVVEVTQADVNQFGGYPLSDAVLVKAIAALEPLQPSAIAIDMHRAQPRGEGRSALIAQFQQNANLLTVCAFAQSDQNYAAPPEFSTDQKLEQLGFSNLVLDTVNRSQSDTLRTDVQSEQQSSKQTVRRQLLSYDPNIALTRSTCTTPYSLSFQLAYRFLQKSGIQPIQVTADQRWQFGSTIFNPLPTRFGAYQTLERANQTMLNYRTAPPGQQIPLQKVLNRQVTAEMVRDRIVFIGYTAPVARDTFATPYGEMAGVWIHAHSVSQLLSSVLNQRSSIWGLPQWQHFQWGDTLWVLIWSGITAMIVTIAQSRPLILGIAIAVFFSCIYQLCLYVLKVGGWLPLVPTLITMLLTAIGVVFYLRVDRR
ncbi:CHASE2 domain-containing protein [Leptolyngbya sp. NIES-2104]|uniref:CHASE2 domain-containing protein n=1 Tax=Leptolyngbya sp. NIES-2104 TaxID=1552121 RepID=UPI0006EC8EAF|nr:CHASE2 domain-containing protein [Leptolyngbya sp. NIES-2104]GAP94211.1 adenylate cyclase [Leptolyngbya sp. NIES-2104]